MIYFGEIYMCHHKWIKMILIIGGHPMLLGIRSQLYFHDFAFQLNFLNVLLMLLFLNQDSEHLCSAVIHDINATTEDNWILDSGSTTNMTSNRAALSFIEEERNTIKTPIGKKVLTEKGKLNHDINDVLVNPNSDINLVSVTKYLQDHEECGILLTKNAAYEIDQNVVIKTPYKCILADQVILTKGLATTKVYYLVQINNILQKIL